MSNALISNETVPAGAGWCYTAEAFEAARNVSGKTENGTRRSLMMAPSSFGLPSYKFTAKETVQDMEKQLRLTRLEAFGRSLTGQGWS